ncbi:hypothetical protein PFICI_04868 [Pestalotiopsis fici W106-1]|uniref:Uncharacterized protein n=1 Tax=Pestalotiopsis fici (strain W106-1 / CGMCC3.15140) TaxID=1229662 RepID=W3XC26_PESFW|nr:uncharacterized protein PFICI_04868 [Pestalotiopsis fici W106-1]ETS82992.1 hypothetical protein PFICI_04868 [Pestalotiopsis fici W106-1]
MHVRLCRGDVDLRAEQHEARNEGGRGGRASIPTTWLSAALGFASAMLGATVIRFGHLQDPEEDLDTDDILVYPAVGSIAASVLSVFVYLTLQTVATVMKT